MERSYMERKWMTLEDSTKIKPREQGEKYTSGKKVMQIKKIGSHLPISFILIIKLLKPKRRQRRKEKSKKKCFSF